MVRKIGSVPAPFGKIPYHDEVVKDGVTYSIDLFRPRFPLNWYDLKILNVITKDGSSSYLEPTDDLVISAVTQLLDKCFFALPEYILHPYKHIGQKAFSGGVFWWWQIGNLRISLHKFSPFSFNQQCFSLLLEFNPNKIDDFSLSFAKSIISFLKTGFSDKFVWDNTRCDFTIDVPYSISDIRLLSRKSSSSYQGTYYFGIRGTSGYTRVYDKFNQMLDIYHVNIGSVCTRIEFEQRHGEDFVMDQPYLICDLGQHEVLRYVPMNAWPDALRTFDERTARKIKKSCLKEIPFDRSIFDDLYIKLLDRVGLDVSDIRVNHHLERDLKDFGYDTVQLERDMATLRKWAKNND